MRLLSRHIAIVVTLLVLTAVLVLYKQAVNQRDERVVAPSAAAGSVKSAAEPYQDSLINDGTGGDFGSPPASSDTDSRFSDTGVMQRSSAPVTARALDPATVVADMSGGGPVAAMRPPSGGPSIIDVGLPGPNPTALRLGQTESTAAIDLPEMSQPVANITTPTFVGPGPSETDLRLPGPGESAE